MDEAVGRKPRTGVPPQVRPGRWLHSMFHQQASDGRFAERRLAERPCGASALRAE